MAKTKSEDPIRDALQTIISAANEFNEPIHYKVREAIMAARNVIREEDERIEEEDARIDRRFSEMWKSRKGK